MKKNRRAEKLAEIPKIEFEKIIIELKKAGELSSELVIQKWEKRKKGYARAISGKN